MEIQQLYIGCSMTKSEIAKAYSVNIRAIKQHLGSYHVSKEVEFNEVFSERKIFLQRKSIK